MAKRGTIALDTIIEEFFVRAKLDDDHVLQLADLYEAGVAPTLSVTREGNKLIDGRHRLAALKLLNKKAVDVEWDEETDRGLNLVHALKSNIGGALTPSKADINYAFTQMIEAGMSGAVIIKQFAQFWPHAVVRRYYSDAQGSLTKLRVYRAKTDVIDNGLSVGDAAVKFKIKLDTLKSALGGSKKKRRTDTTELKGTLTMIFRSRGASMGQTMRRIQHQFEDGELTWGNVNQILEHLENCVKSTELSVRDWRKRFEAKRK